LKFPRRGPDLADMFAVPRLPSTFN